MKLLSYPLHDIVLYFTKINWSVSLLLKKIKHKAFYLPVENHRVTDIKNTIVYNLHREIQKKY